MAWVAATLKRVSDSPGAFHRKRAYSQAETGKACTYRHLSAHTDLHQQWQAQRQQHHHQHQLRYQAHLRQCIDSWLNLVMESFSPLSVSLPPPWKQKQNNEGRNHITISNSMGRIVADSRRFHRCALSLHLICRLSKAYIAFRLAHDHNRMLFGLILTRKSRDSAPVWV